MDGEHLFGGTTRQALFIKYIRVYTHISVWLHYATIYTFNIKHFRYEVKIKLASGCVYKGVVTMSFQRNVLFYLRKYRFYGDTSADLTQSII